MRNNLYICNANPQTKTTLISHICGSNFGTHYRLLPTATNRGDLIYGAVGDSLVANPAMSDADFDAFLSLNTDEMWNLFLKYDYFG